MDAKSPLAAQRHHALLAAALTNCASLTAQLAALRLVAHNTSGYTNVICRRRGGTTRYEAGSIISWSFHNYLFSLT